MFSTVIIVVSVLLTTQWTDPTLEIEIRSQSSLATTEYCLREHLNTAELARLQNGIGKLIRISESFKR